MSKAPRQSTKSTMEKLATQVMSTMQLHLQCSQSDGLSKHLLPNACPPRLDPDTAQDSHVEHAGNLLEPSFSGSSGFAAEPQRESSTSILAEFPDVLKRENEIVDLTIQPART